jgi:hypothetical protein
MRTLAHIINPVIVKAASDLFIAQPITFETMKRARDFARGQVEVALWSAQYPEDRPLVPDEFQMTPDLERSMLDLGTFQKPRKLPLLVDILDRLYQASDAEYFLYTNVDIALMPNFYLTVNALIEAGYDALVINRRTITDRFQTIEEIPLMYAEVGQPHEGYDCFVFRREVYRRYQLGRVCLGIPWVGRTLIWNLICHAKNFREFQDSHLTFHIGTGNDRAWQGEEYADYRAHNEREFLMVLRALEKQYGPFDWNGPLAPYLAVIFEGKRKTGRRRLVLHDLGAIGQFLRRRVKVP